MNYFDTTINDSNHWMRFGAGPVALGVGLNMPEALRSQGEGDAEIAQGLPPYRPRRAYLVDEYPACPANWMRSSGRIKSYFVPVMENHGLWLDFNTCNHHPNNVAIVISVQGVNAVTGLPCKDAQLEQYRDECPKHKKPFGPDRLCKECGFKWPKQNYLSSTGTPFGHLWLDGFRSEDGKVRQYIFTDKEMRGVAKAIIGEDRVFALGISFFLSKEPRPVVRHEVLRGYHTFGGSPKMICAVPEDSLDFYNTTATAAYGDDGPAGPPGSPDTSFRYTCSTATSNLYDGKPKKGLIKARSAKMSASAPLMYAASAPIAAAPITPVTSVKQLEIAAGARIDQQVYDDPNDLDYWQKEPEGLIVINYVSQSDAMKIIQAGKIDLSGSKEGFLTNVPKGNP